MTEDASTPPSMADRERRRGSLARRALQSVRAVMNRRSSGIRSPTASSSAEVRNVAAVRIVEPTSSASVGAERNDIPGSVIEDVGPIRAVEAPVVSLAAMRNTIEVDNSDDDDETVEPLLPMRMGRSGLSTEKARELFAQHGFDYELRGFQPHQEPPNKIRRVEKPIRLRVHYTCHECQRKFGVEKTCLQCGHQRCRVCARDPPRRVKELSDRSRKSMQADEAAKATAAAVASTETCAKVPAIEPAVPAPESAPEMLTGPLLLDESSEYTTEPLPKDFEFTMYARPRTGIQTMWRADSRPRVHKQSHSASLTSSEDDVPMVRTVKRVYRKPRQRVRYTCENCSTLFIEGVRCYQCGHERCQHCHREP